jgi:hypothetical protein
VLNLVALFGFVLVPWASVTLGTAAAAGVGLAVFSAVMTVLAASTLALARRPVGGGLRRPGRLVGAQEAGGTDELAGASAARVAGERPARRVHSAVMWAWSA